MSTCLQYVRGSVNFTFTLPGVLADGVSASELRSKCRGTISGVVLLRGNLGYVAHALVPLDVLIFSTFVDKLELVVKELWSGVRNTAWHRSCHALCPAPLKPRLPYSYLAKSRPQSGCLAVTSSPPDSALTR